MVAMFNRYHIQHSPASVSVRVTEQRAPTDASVRLLRDMEKAATERVLETMRLESNTVKAVVQRMENDFDGTTIFRIVYEINGQRRVMTRVVTEAHTTIQARAKDVWTALANDIATFILTNFTKGVYP